MRGPACFYFFIKRMKKKAILIERLDLLCRVQGVSGRYPSGQRGQTVNLLPSASKVRILACPPHQACTTWESKACVIKCEIGFVRCRVWEENGRA